jgi:hypothetical protein
MRIGFVRARTNKPFSRSMFLFVTVHLPNQVQNTGSWTACFSVSKEHSTPLYVVSVQPSIYQNHRSDNACFCLKPTQIKFKRKKGSPTLCLLCVKRLSYTLCSSVYLSYIKTGFSVHVCFCLRQTCQIEFKSQRRTLMFLCVEISLDTPCPSVRFLYIKNITQTTNIYVCLCEIKTRIYGGIRNFRSKIKSGWGLASICSKMSQSSTMFEVSWFCSKHLKSHFRLWMESSSYLLKNAGKPTMFASSWLCSKLSNLNFEWALSSICSKKHKNTCMFASSWLCSKRSNTHF